MTSVAVKPGHSPGEDFCLDNIPRDHHQQYKPEARGLGIYQSEGYAPGGYMPACHDEPHYVHNPPTPRSNTDDGMRVSRARSNTRGRTDSPFASSSPKSRVSHSPMARSGRKDKKSKLDKSKTPKLTAPLSVLTKNMEVPLRDIGAWVNRSVEERHQEVEKRNGYVTRPMNSFMLYRSAYAERTKQWCLQNNHQVVSSVSGASWPLESPEVRDQFNEWAKTERANHQAAHPQYKFSPSKANSKRGRRGEFSDEDEEPLDIEDPDGDYRGPRVKRRPRDNRDSPYLHHNDPFASTHHPYYGNQFGVYASPEYQQAMPAGRPLPSNIAYDQYGHAYDPHTHRFYAPQQPQFTYSHDQQAVRVPTPTSMTSAAGGTSLGGFGMPGSSNTDDLFNTSPRTQTPMQSFDSYGRPVFVGQQHQQSGQQVHAFQRSHSQFHHPTTQPHTEPHQYMQQHLQTSQAVDPSLSIAFADFNAADHHKSHFENALDEGFTPAEYYNQHTSPNATLAPHWSPADEFKKTEF